MENNLAIGNYSPAPLSSTPIPTANDTTTSLKGSDAKQPSAHTYKEIKAAERQGQQVSISDEQLVKALDRAIKAMSGASTSLKFSVHEKTKQIMVKVVDSETGEVIREVPPEKNLDLISKMWELAGLFVDERR